MRILIIEDDPKTSEYMHQGLTESGFVVDTIDNGVDAVFVAQQHPYDVIILDINLPFMDGWEVLKRIRPVCSARIMMVTAHGRLEEKVRGLEIGADDYLVKPFQFPELLARVRSLMRRTEKFEMPQALRIADLELDHSRHRAFRGGKRIELTTKEFALLHLLMRHSGEVMSRTQIISTVWDMNFDCETNVVEVTIRRLRAKVDDPFETKLIHTLRGVGYTLEERP